ncbi:hypothetical protein COO60DRAFT_810130 [Scenedesmus sp. NREL 46B-D3]|nr:hypothetical protein COO60DRAFT_810130 [Scenedesmus sp. NREL 46B-D3]
MRQLMGRPDGPPVRYLMTQLTGLSHPLTYPDHGGVMELRNAKHRLRSLKGWRDRKELSRQIRFRLLQMQQMSRRQQRTSDLLCKATRAGGKMQLAQPRTATRVRPSVQPPVGHRYRALEPGAGWIVRPHIEPHGMDNADNVEGFMAEKAGVARPSSSSSGGGGGSADQLLRGLPYRISSSASASKEQLLVQARGELSMYHDLQGLATSTLSADVQTSGAAGPASPDMLMVLRLDSQRRGFPVAANSPALGLMLARLAHECRLHRGPVAAGVRLQDCVRVSGPGGAPVELDLALGKLFCRAGLEPDDAWGANAEVRTDARQLLGSRHSAPLSLSGSLMNHRGETMAALSAAMQVQRGRRSGVGGKLQLNSRGVASLGLQVRSDGPQWWGLVGLVPLFNLGWEMVASVLAGGGGAAGGAEYEEQQQQQQQGEQQQTAAAQQ